MDDNRIKVNFPSKMEVESPEIDSINKTAQRVSNLLHNNMKEIVKPLQVLSKLPELLADFKAKIVEQFQLMFSNQIEAQALSRKANIRATEQKIKLVEEHIGKKQVQLEEAKKRITDRYSKISTRLEEQHGKYLRRLDSHVYEITDKVYPKQVEEKFSLSSIPAQQLMVAHIAESAISRSKCLKEGYEEAEININKFLEERETFYREIEETSSDIVSEGDYELPFWFAEVEDVDTGKRRVEVFFEWEVNDKECLLKDKEKAAIIDYAKSLVNNLAYKNISKEDGLALENQLSERFGMSKDDIRLALNDSQNIFID